MWHVIKELPVCPDPHLIFDRYQTCIRRLAAIYMLSVNSVNSIAYVQMSLFQFILPFFFSLFLANSPKYTENWLIS